MLVSRKTLATTASLLLALLVTVSCYAPHKTEAEEATTSDEVATENTESTEEDFFGEAPEASRVVPDPDAPAKNSPFPTPEEQRDATLAYNLLSMELEKLTEEELQRVKAMGYEGGLRVTNSVGLKPNTRVAILNEGDHLVGLHAWPTESLAQVREILLRDDLDQLSPLKFYVVRREIDEQRFEETQHRGFVDKVSTGRISVNLDAWRAIRQQQEIAGQDFDLNRTVPHRFDAPRMLQQHLAELKHELEQLEQEIPRLEDKFTRPENNHEQKLVESALERVRARREQILQEREQARLQMAQFSEQLQGEQRVGHPAMLLYDGKTFDEWRELWKTELKTENRIECIQALAAFGRAGYGKQAVEAILDVAEQYDFTLLGDGAEGKLQETILKMFGIKIFGADPGMGITNKELANIFLGRLENGSPNSRSLANWLLPSLKIEDEDAWKRVLAIAEDENNPLSRSATQGLIDNDRDLSRPETLKLVHQALQRDQPYMEVLGTLCFRRLDLVPEQLDLLFHENRQVRSSARIILQDPSEPLDNVIDQLLTILADPTQGDKHADAIRALYATGGWIKAPDKNRVVTLLEEIVRTGDEQLLAPALATLNDFNARGTSLSIQQAIKGGEVSEERKQLLHNTESLEGRVNDEVKQENLSRGFGGGGIGGGRGLSGGGGGFF